MTATNALAQDAALPEIVVPTVPTVTEAAPAKTTQPAPQIVIPDPTTSPATTIAAESGPTVTAAPVEQVEAAPIATAPSVSQPTATTLNRSESSARAVVSDAADVSSTRQADAANDAEIAGLPATDTAIDGDGALAATSAATALPVSGDVSGKENNATLTMAGGAAALGFGFIGLFMAGSARRRRRDRHGATAAITDERKAMPLRKRVPDAAAAPNDAMVAEARPVAVQRRQPNVTYGGSKWDDAGFVNASPTIAVLPTGDVPRSAEGRRALLKRLVRARPDEANPFRSPKARRRRARLIVQSLTERLREQPNLDFRRFYQGFAQRRNPVA
ncbi:hypothetical protein [Croceicoccus sediminis]|uniref:hypothetical protein n=1 Tax=Croceicoccus sediminis TaxID=2571150 RepID=UPI001182CB43|nr:hypothetical protein [Croceicoccus sediminis]